MKNILIISHHPKGGGSPLDSLWFSKEECLKRDIQLKFFWTKHFGRSVIKEIKKADRIIFDGLGSTIVYRGPLILLLAFLYRKPLGLYWHETDYFIRGKWPLDKSVKMSFRKALDDWNFFKRRIPVYHFMRSNKVVHFHVCNYGKKLLEECIEVDGERIQVLNNISDPEKLLKYNVPNNSEENIVVSIGLVNERKFPESFINIAEGVLKQLNDFKFVWIGPFTEGKYSREAIDDLIDKKGLTGKVEFVGYNDNPAEILYRSKLYIHTAKDDPMPKVLMESLGLGKPIVAYGVCGIPELVGDYGRLVQVGDEAGFIENVVEVLTNPDELQEERRDYYIQKYTPQSFAERFDNCLSWWSSLKL